jgi:hypothetical protein
MDEIQKKDEEEIESHSCDGTGSYSPGWFPTFGPILAIIIKRPPSCLIHIFRPVFKQFTSGTLAWCRWIRWRFCQTTRVIVVDVVVVTRHLRSRMIALKFQTKYLNSWLTFRKTNWKFYPHWWYGIERVFGTQNIFIGWSVIGFQFAAGQVWFGSTRNLDCFQTDGVIDWTLEINTRTQLILRAFILSVLNIKKTNRMKTYWSGAKQSDVKLPPSH